MKDVKKTVLWVLVGFCMISVIAGLFSLFAFLQMATMDIDSIGLGKAEEKFFTASTAVAVVCAVACVAFIIYTAIQFLKNNQPEKSKLVSAFLIVTIILSAVFIVYPFLTPSIFKLDNDTFMAYKTDFFTGKTDILYYSTFLHYQTYLSAILSTFIPLLISSGLILGTVICRKKFQNHK